MPSKPLIGKTIIITGSKKVETVTQLIEANGGKALSFPLIEVKEVIHANDVQRLQLCNDYDWLIFTSQNAVTAFVNKCARAGIAAQHIRCKIAVVGERTAQALRAHQFFVHFMPSVYSADMFVQEFNEQGRALFVRGSLAKETITVGIGADEWTVYETVPCMENIQALEEAIVGEQQPIVVFASPSAVHVYAKEIVPILDWGYAKYATIGHVTTEALAQYGMTPIVQPKTYTMQALIKQLILEDLTR